MKSVLFGLILMSSMIVFGQMEDEGMTEGIQVSVAIGDVGPVDNTEIKAFKNRIEDVLRNSHYFSNNRLTQFTFFITGKQLSSNAGVTAGSEYTVQFLAKLGVLDRLMNRVIHMEEIEISGVGKDEQEATINMLDNLSRKKDKISEIVEMSQNPCIDGYAGDCKEIVIKLEQLKEENQKLKALAYMFRIPKQSGECSEMAQEILNNWYTEYAMEQCPLIFDRAKSSLANKEMGDFQLALDQLTEMGYCSDQESELETILKSKKMETELKQLKEKVAKMKVENKSKDPLTPKLMRVTRVEENMENESVIMEEREMVTRLVAQ